MKKLVTCKTCGAEIAKTAKRCPKCGAQQHIVALSAVSVIVVITIVLIIFVAANGSANSQTEESVQDTTPAVSEVIFDSDNIKITYTGMELTQYLENQPEAYMLTVSLTIENSSGYDITVYPVDASVNDVMKTATSGIPLDVLSGKKSITGFFFANLEGTGIDSVDDMADVKTIEFSLSIVDTDTYGEIVNSGSITITPN